MGGTNHHASITVPATTEHLHTIRDFVREETKRNSVPEHDENEIILAVDEACSNLIRHAYGNDANKSITISLVISPESVRVEIEDSSHPFDPREATLPNMQEYFDQHRHGGLGILIMRRLMDDIEYVPCNAQHACNVLILTKKRRAS